MVALLLAAVAVAVVAALTLGGGSSVQTLQGSSFTTSYPAGWRMTVHHADGIAEYQLSSTAATPDGYGIPPAGTIAITIGEVPAAVVASHPLTGGAPDLSAGSQDATELLPNVVGTPAGALNESITTAGHPTTLDGIDAAAIVYAYSNSGLQNVQSDIVARRGTEIFNAELDTEPSLESQGNAALATIIADWHWK
jgi:hypothetical protein